MTTLPRIQHVSIPRPSGEETAVSARNFYGELLGLPEIPVPDSLAGRGLIWFQLGATEIHIFVEDFEGGAKGSHFCIAVVDYQAVRQKLEGAGVFVRDTTPIPGRPRFFTRDPFGNSIEISTILE